MSSKTNIKLNEFQNKYPLIYDKIIMGDSI